MAYLQERLEAAEKELAKLNGLVGQQGPRGESGKDANTEEIINTLRVEIGKSFASAQEALSQMVLIMVGHAIVQELKTAGVVDSEGRAILLPGPVGPTGNSGPAGQSIVGPAGRAGESITGPAGRDGVDGKSPDVSELVSAAQSQANQFVEWKLSELQSELRNLILQILQERKVLDAQGNAVPGPEGKSGTPGPGVTPSDISQMEAKYRAIWKSDIQIALRAHFAESHQ
jgi:hypothetical protein